MPQALTNKCVSSKGLEGNGWTVLSSMWTILELISWMLLWECNRSSVRNFLQVNIFTWSKISASMTTTCILEMNISLKWWESLSSASRPIHLILILGPLDLINLHSWIRVEGIHYCCLSDTGGRVWQRAMAFGFCVLKFIIDSGYKSSRTKTIKVLIKANVIELNDIMLVSSTLGSCIWAVAISCLTLANVLHVHLISCSTIFCVCN
jgi:hypothetical protein